jgi:carboxymethylenebutenolidase
MRNAKVGRVIAIIAGVAMGAPLLLVQLTVPGQAEAMPKRVAFLSADSRTRLVGYLFKPARMQATRVPAVVMMHGRAGAYSSGADGVYDATTLSKRHKLWGRLWSERGYIALLVDGFGPRGYPRGFPRFSYHQRPPEVDEVTMRPLDAYGALAYLRTRGDVVPDRIGLHGWSNGASATLAAMTGIGAPGGAKATAATGFRAALAFYPACGLKGRFDDGYRPYAPVRVFHGTDDEEVSARRCSRLVREARTLGGDIAIRVYDGATHGFDDPSWKRRRIKANATAAEDAIERAERFFAEELAGG